MCLGDSREKNKVSCSFDWHSDSYFGLCQPDRRNLFGELPRSYKVPSKADVKKNAAHIDGFIKRKMKEDSGIDD